MRKRINRRDFMKLSAALSSGLMGYPFLKFIPSTSQADAAGRKNILIIVFDAFSARHISLYGYNRETTPNIARLAERAIVYHNHHAGGNFTTPGTASLLTGVLPWRHRAFNLYSPVTKPLANASLFHAFHEYYRVAYSHNPAAVALLDQFSSGLNRKIPLEKFLLNSDESIKKLFSKDEDIALLGWARSIKGGNGYAYSLFLSGVYEQFQKNRLTPFVDQFPRGMPSVYEDNYFTLEMVTEWLGVQVSEFPRPFLGYFHFIPPHHPYGTRLEFVNAFKNDGFHPVEKAVDLFPIGSFPERMPLWRQMYDEFILYVDREFGKLFDQLEKMGVLDDTWVVLTSDHGEMFERGIIGHVTQVLYEPVVHVPLMIFEPGRSTRIDIHTPTSAIDLFPTLLHITGKSALAGLDGLVLPPFSDSIKTSNRSVYAVQSRYTASDAPLSEATLMQIKDNYKLMYFIGYEELQGGERVELYDLAEDPEELNNLFSAQPIFGKKMLDELKAKLSEMNKPYL